MTYYILQYKLELLHVKQCYTFYLILSKLSNIKFSRGGV